MSSSFHCMSPELSINGTRGKGQRITSQNIKHFIKSIRMRNRMSGKNLRDICFATCKLVAVLLILRDATKPYGWSRHSDQNSVRKEAEKNQTEMKYKSPFKL